MATHRILVVVGTRPEAIKMAPVVAALRPYAPEVETRVVFTGQHTTLVDQVLAELDLVPDRELGIMREGQSLYDVVEGALRGLRDVVRELQPDLVLVQGDTATVFVASLVGFFEGVRVGHVEAGLRSGNRRAPFPEEILRRMTDVVAELHFAPTERARALLLAENVDPATVHVTGNTVVDALLAVASRERAVKDPTLADLLARGARPDGAGGDGDGVGRRRIVLLTAHRRESFGPPLRDLFGAVRTLADEHEDVDVVYPVHPNPNVREPAAELLSGHPRIHLLDPLDYLDLVTVMRAAALVLTDSGGIQEEAPTFGVPVLVLREVTERPEGVEAGVAEIVGTDPGRILARARHHLSAPAGSSVGENPYGDGRAGERIADILVSGLTGAPRRTTDWKGGA